MNKFYIIRAYWSETYLNYCLLISTSSNKLIDIVNKNIERINPKSPEVVEYDVFCIENPYSLKEMKKLKEASQYQNINISVFGKHLEYLKITPLFVIKNKLKNKEIKNLEQIGHVINDVKLLFSDSLIFLDDLQEKINNYNSSINKPIHEYLQLSKKDYNNLIEYGYVDIDN